MSIRSVTSVRTVSTNLPQKRSRECSGGIFTASMPTLAKSASNDAVNCPVPDQELEVRGVIAEIHEQVADLPCGPRPVRVRGHAEDMHIPGADLDHEEAVQALQGDRAVHVEEVGRKHRRCLHACLLPSGHLPGRGITPIP